MVSMKKLTAQAQLEKLLVGLQAAADEAGIAFKTQQVGGMFGFLCTLPIKKTLLASTQC